MHAVIGAPPLHRPGGRWCRSVGILGGTSVGRQGGQMASCPQPSARRWPISVCIARLFGLIDSVCAEGMHQASMNGTLPCTLVSALL